MSTITAPVTDITSLLADQGCGIPSAVDKSKDNNACDEVKMMGELRLKDASLADLLAPFPPKPDASLSLMELVQAISQALAGRTTKDAALIKHVGDLMASYDASQNEWKRYEFFDEHKQYTRNLIATDNSTFTLMLLCWNRNKASPVHDHAGSECWMRVIKGTVEEVRYTVPEDENRTTLDVIDSRQCGAGGVVFINDNIGLHKVGNPSADEDAVTMHLYAPPFECCKTFLGGLARSTVSFVTFYSENGSKVDMH